jgi:acetyl-CoA C-acetyltransferase
LQYDLTGRQYPHLQKTEFMKYKTPIYIVAAKRTPIGRFGGGLKDISAVELARQVLSASIDDAMREAAGIVVAGQVIQAGAGMNPARQVLLAAGFAQGVPAFTVNTVCGSGLKAVADVARTIDSGDVAAGLAAGMESMSQAPFYSRGTRWGVKYGNSTLDDSLVVDGLSDPLLGIGMGETAERIAEKFGVTRVDQDAFAAESQRRAGKADFSSEIVPVKTKKETLERDEHPRPDTTAEKLATLKPAFRGSGTVTAGNASGLNDGAACVFLAGADAIEKHGWKPMARLVGDALVGCDPAMMGMGPVGAVTKLLGDVGWKIDDVESVELNEAFAAQSLACIRELGLSQEIVNPRGGAIALGHPIGCSGARILTSLVHYMTENSLKRGMATLCIGGGMGIAMAVERDQ